MRRFSYGLMLALIFVSLSSRAQAQLNLVPEPTEQSANSTIQNADAQPSLSDLEDVLLNGDETVERRASELEGQFDTDSIQQESESEDGPDELSDFDEMDDLKEDMLTDDDDDDDEDASLTEGDFQANDREFAVNATAKSIDQISLSFQPSLPAPNTIRISGAAQYRPVAQKSFHWQADDMSYQNLLFEEPALERHGYCRPGQSVRSGAIFVGRAIVLPVNLLRGDHKRCDNPLGWGQPGTGSGN